MLGKVSANITQLIKQGDVVSSKIDALQDKAVEQAITARAAHKRIDELKEHIDFGLKNLNESVKEIDGSVKKNTEFRENAKGVIGTIVFIVGLIGTGIGSIIAKYF